MAESERGEADEDNVVSDAPASDEDSLDTKCLMKNKGQQMESPVEEKNCFMKSLKTSLKGVNERSPKQPPTSPNSASAIKKAGWKFSSVIKKSEPEQPQPIPKVIDSSNKPGQDVKEVVRDIYCLPEIPSVPLSVMEINKLIEKEVLEEAYVNLLSLRLDFQREHHAQDREDYPVELVHREKDLHLLYETLRNKMSNIICSSSILPSRNKELVLYVAHIILEEEKRQGDPGAMLGWREGWRDSIREGVRDTLKKVPLGKCELNPSWLAVHLGVLGKTVVEDLESVKTELLDSYPPEFDVFETYVFCHHEVVGEHLKSLLEQVTELKDYYAFLDFILNRYPSVIMSSSSLQPEMRAEWKTLPVDMDFLNQIKSKYCNRLQTDMRTSLDRIIELEIKDMWKNREKPMISDGLYSSHIDMDIWTKIEGFVKASRKIEANFEQKVVHCCLEELKLFPERFMSAFAKWSSHLSNCPYWTEYHISYINSFDALKEHMECYRKTCPIPLEQVQKEIDGLTRRLSLTLMEQFKKDVKPFLEKQMTKTWFSSNKDFSQLISRTSSLSEQTKHMRSTCKETLVNEAHFFVVKEYISQLMKSNYSCKNKKNETAASKITRQWEELKALFQEMNSTSDWLHPVGNQLSQIIGCEKSDIKHNLKPLVDNYPDIRRSHLAAVLYFRGLIRGQEKQAVLQQLAELKQSIEENKEYAFFSEIQAAETTGCFAYTPFTCLSSSLPDD